MATDVFAAPSGDEVFRNYSQIPVSKINAFANGPQKYNFSRIKSKLSTYLYTVI
jgi:hypothetical protein